VYNLLAQNYVEDDGATFRFDYSRDFLKWYPRHVFFHHVGFSCLSGSCVSECVCGVMQGVDAAGVFEGVALSRSVHFQQEIVWIYYGRSRPYEGV
jgi:hypothetical protein